MRISVRELWLFGKRIKGAAMVARNQRLRRRLPLFVILRRLVPRLVVINLKSPREMRGPTRAKFFHLLPDMPPVSPSWVSIEIRKAFLSEYENLCPCTLAL